MRSRFWSILSLLALVAAILCWIEGDRRQAGSKPVPTPVDPNAATQQVTRAAAVAPVSLLTRVETLRQAAVARAPETTASAAALLTDPVFPLRLRNTARPLAELTRSDTAILLRNALLDSAIGDRLSIPDPLQAGPEPGAYIVQARGRVNDAFRAQIAASGGRLVSYIPNNAYLVRITSLGAATLQSSAQAVMPFEPYFKLEPGLLERAVNGEPVPDDTLLRVTAYAEDRAAVLDRLHGLGVVVVDETRGNVGYGPEPQFLVEPQSASLASLAALPGVQLIEPHHDRALLVDLTRERLAAAEDTVTLTNYLGLTGSNVWVNINDSGVWGDHPDLKDRVFAHATNELADPYGHGTHVAGIIASSGVNGPTGTNAPSGSLTNASFRGFATNASLFVLPVDRTLGPLVPDIALQEIAAATNYNTLERTNALISNNSWGYARVYDYDSAAASYDAAVRDALPDQTGSQAMLYVFAAGNAGFGNNVGSGGSPGTITSPATAKNVITVGALENLREVLMEVVVTNQVTNIVDGEFVVTNVVQTNDVAIEITDSDDEVAPFSSRGNVGLGVEGDRGRFKPDLVAPGTFIVSTRTTNWTVDFTRTNSIVFVYPAQIVAAEDWNNYSVQVPSGTTSLTITTFPEPASPSPFPALQIYARFGQPATPADFQGTNEVVIADPDEGPWYYSIVNPTQLPVPFGLRVRLDVQFDTDEYIELLRELNEPLEPYYRYDSGTSASAAAVSGLLALMQEFFERELDRPWSPALMKALLINGARSASSLYNLEVQSQVNYQGWGLPLLTNVLPAAITNQLDQPETWPLQWVDQSPTNALATGETHIYEVGLTTNAIASDLRVTLVWTDPPANPAASIKLVNDLDLVVSNKVTGFWYYGNDILAASDYNRANSTNQAPGASDNINNVENVFLRPPLDTNYAVYVSARRVNVNAVTAQTNAIVQDYALVLSIGGTNALTLTPQPALATNVTEATIITNGVPILYQRAGANSPLIGTRDGTTNQWHFYVFTNRYDTNLVGGETNFGQYVAFLTFTPPNLSVPRTAEEGDIDMYVTRTGPTNANPGASNLVSLDPAQLDRSFQSLSRVGTELVAFEDAEIGEVFYVGIKSEDQMSAEYGIIGLSSDEPFGNLLPDGSYEILGRPLPRLIPDGSPNDPGAALVFGVGVYPMVVGRAIAYLGFAHEQAGDLLGNLSHSGRFAVLNNHSTLEPGDDGIANAIFDDTGTAIEPLAVPSDGPGSLIDFVGSQGTGVWQFTMVDNAIAHTGRVEDVRIRIFPAPDLLAGAFVTLQPNQFEYFYVDVPADASLLRILLSQMTLPIDVFARYENPPSLLVYDKAARIPPPSGEMTISQTDIPPLRPGRYFVGVFNPNGVATSFYIRAVIERSLGGPLRRDLVATNDVPLEDDRRMFFTNYVDTTLTVADVMVGIRVEHPRVSDLAFSLISPQGTRTLLVENRGGTNSTAYGYDTVETNFHHVALTYRTNTGLAALYLDGVEQGRRQITNVVPETRHSLFFGRMPTLTLSLTDGSFEVPGIPENSHRYEPAGSPWQFNSRAGIVHPSPEDANPVFDAPAPVQGRQVAVLQYETTAGELSQPVTFPANGAYIVSYSVAGRGPDSPDRPYDGDLTYRVLLDGTVIATDTTVSFQPFTRKRFEFQATAGVRVLTFQATGTEGDHAAFLDDVRIESSLGGVPSRQYFGQLDEVDLYGRALEASELLGIYLFGGAGKPTNELVSRWSFDGTGEDTLTNNPANIFGPTFVPGRFDLGLNYAFEGDHVVVTNSTSLDVGGRGGFTLDAWVNPTDLSTNRLLAIWGDSTNRVGVEFGFHPGTDTNAPAGLLYANIRDRSGSNHVLEATTQGLIRTNAVVTNVVYISFTEDTNLTVLPIKFAEPDTAPTGRSTNQLLSGFESRVMVPVTTLDPGDLFDGWTVAAGNPSVLRAPLAHTGTNLLALRDGALFTEAPTEPGRMYRLEFAHRREPYPGSIVSWWDGQNSTNDIVGTNHAVGFNDLGYGPGKVGQAFALTNTAYLEVAHSDSLSFTNQLSLELWYLARNYGPAGTNLIYKADPDEPALVNYFVNLSAAGVDVGFNDLDFPGTGSDLAGGVEGLRFTPLPAVNRFHHLVATYRQTTNAQVELTLFLDGVRQRSKTVPGVLSNTVNVGPLVIGRGDFDGMLDELTVYNRALTEEEVLEIYWMDSLGKARPPALPATVVRVDGAANTVVASDPLWQTNGMTFLATRTNALIEVARVLPGALLDSFSLRELPATTFFPEEPLKPFVGENALGDWKLEVVDRRVGATNELEAAFLQWQLQLTFAPLVVPAVTLTNGLVYTNTVETGQARYFIVEVPLEAGHATNTLVAAGPLDLWFNHAGIPTYGDSGTDYHLLTNRTDGVAVVLTNETQILETNLTAIAATPAPILEPGQRYYLALTNQTGAAVPFSIQVDFDNFTGEVGGVRELGFGQTITTNIPATTALQYYRYNVTTNAIAASFQVTPTNGDVNLYLRKATPTRNPLPTPQRFDYASENTGTNAEAILLTRNSIPVPLSSGPWYLGVLNVDPQPVNYSIRVIEYTNIIEQIIDLEAGVTRNDTVNPAALSRLYYRFTVTGSPAAVQFDLTDLTGRADLLVKRDVLPTPFDYDFVDAAAPGLPARLVIRAGGSGASLDGEWYLQVYNLESAPISFGITATYPPPGPVIWPLRDSVPFLATIPADTPGLPQVPQYFSFVVPEGATNVTFQLTPLNGNADMLLRQGALPDLTTFDYFSFNAGLAPEIIRVDAQSLPVPLVPGDWYVAAYNGSLFSTTYEMLVTTLPAGLTGEIILDPNLEFGPGGVTLRWTAPANLTFQVQYATGIAADGTVPWITIPGTVTSATTAYQFTDDGSLTGGLGGFKLYRVVQVSSGGGGPVRLDAVPEFNGGVVTIRWTAEAGLNFQVQYAIGIPASGVPAWINVPGLITSATTRYEFRDDGSLTGGSGGVKLYRVLAVP